MTTSGSSLPAPRDDLGALEGYHSPQLDVSVRLNTNESPFPPPPQFVDAWLAALRSVPLHRYPDRAARALRGTLGARLGQPAERVFGANGSNEVLQTLLLAYGGPGRSALLFEPTYALHARIARITGTAVVTAERGDDFRVDPDSAGVQIAANRPAVVLLCSPNNPTGTVEDPATVRSVVEAARAVGALVIVDEAYGEFARDTALDLVDDDIPLVVVRTYSKVWSLAALRLGFGIAPRGVVEVLEQIVLPYHLGAATQVAGTVALEYESEMRARVAMLVEERERVLAALEDQGGIRPFPSGANFVLFRVDGDGHALWRGLLSQGVLVRDFSRWPRVEDCLRVTIGTHSENEAFLGALRSLGSAVREHDP